MAERMTPAVDILSDAHRQNLHADYDRLRREDPVHANEGARAFILTRYRDVERVLTQGTLPCSIPGSVALALRRSGLAAPAVQAVLDAALFMNAGASHPTERRALVAALNLRALPELATVTQRIADELLDKGLRDGGMDVVADFADPLPMRVISHLIGFSEADLAFVYPRVHGIGDVLFRLVPSLRALLALEAAVAEATDLIAERVAERRRKPRDDAMSRLAAWDDGTGGLDDRTIAARILFLQSVASDTTACFISGALLRALGDRSVPAALLGPDDRLAPVIDELLRLEASILFASRITTDTLQFDDGTIPAGRIVLPMIAAANRDPEIYRDPHAFDPARKNRTHLTFGEGLHVCIGGALSRLEGRIALPSFCRLPTARRATATVAYAPVEFLRRLISLPVEF